MFEYGHEDAGDPVVSAVRRWPSWQFAEREMGGMPEVIEPVRQVALVDLGAWGGDRDRAWAHVLAHLDHHEVALGAFTAEQDADATWLAHRRLGIWGKT